MNKARAALAAMNIYPWVKTLPHKGWLTYFRLYGPTQAYFDKTWVLPDTTAMK